MRNILPVIRRNERVLIAVDAILRSKSAFMSVFLMAFMMSVSLNDSPLTFITYCIIRYSLMGILSVALIPVFKRHPLAAWRCSMLFSLFEISAIILCSDWPGFIYVISLFSALESTLYWRPKMIFDTVEIEEPRRARFKSTGQIITEVVKIIMPIILGFAIDSSSYQQVAIFIFVLSSAQFLISLFFRPRKPNTTAKRPLSKSIEMIFQHGTLQKYIYMQLMRGLLTASGAYIVVATISLNLATGEHNSWRGIIVALGSVVAIAIIAIYRKIAGSLSAQKILLAATVPAVILTPIMVYIFRGDPLVGAMFYVLTESLISSFLDSTIVLVRMQNILHRHIDNPEDRIVIEALGEVFLSIGRAISLGALLLITVFGGYDEQLLFAIITSVLILPMAAIALPHKLATR